MAQIIADELEFLAQFSTWHDPVICVETGAFEGHFTKIARCWFEQVHSVELSEKLGHRLLAWATHPHKVHIGDSRQIVPQLARDLDQSVFWFLDANWWYRPAHLDPGIAGGREMYPLQDELEAIADRAMGDIIVVNEVDTFGKLSEAGRDRRAFSVDSIRAMFPDCAAVLYHNILAIYR